MLYIPMQQKYQIYAVYNLTYQTSIHRLYDTDARMCRAVIPENVLI